MSKTTTVITPGRKPKAGKDLFLSIVRNSGNIIFSSALISELRLSPMEGISISSQKLTLWKSMVPENWRPKFMKNGVFIVTDRKVVEYLCASLKIDHPLAKFSLILSDQPDGSYSILKETLRVSVPNNT